MLWFEHLRWCVRQQHVGSQLEEAINFQLHTYTPTYTHRSIDTQLQYVNKNARHAKQNVLCEKISYFYWCVWLCICHNLLFWLKANKPIHMQRAHTHIHVCTCVKVRFTFVGFSSLNFIYLVHLNKKTKSNEEMS